MASSFDHDTERDTGVHPHGTVVDPRTQRLIALGIAVIVFMMVGLYAAQSGIGSGSRGSAPKLVRASATGVEVRVPQQQVQRLAAAQPVVGTHNSAGQQLESYSYPADGSIAKVVGVASTARVGASTTTAVSSSGASSISLFNGRVLLTNATMRARAAVDGKRRAGGTIGLTPDTKIVVDGKDVPLSANHQVVITGVGTVSLNEQAVVSAAPTGDTQTGPRYHVTGATVHVRLSAPYGGAPAGTELLIGRVDAGVRDRKIVAIKHPASSKVTPVRKPPVVTPAASLTPAPSTGSGSGSDTFSPQAGTPKPGDAALPRKASTVKGKAAGAATGNLQGYVFPVLSSAASFSNDWGAARADVPQGHQGNDIFAAEGTPIVAVADGVLDRVGWNAVGGYRFWLFDQYGNGFYHAHLSAYAPLAVDGARVHAGDVIGFVGHTGDAQGTPNHLHFEIHPGNGDATNPFPYITAWQRGVAVALGAAAGATNDPTRVAPVTVVNIADIAPNSGLQPSVLATVPRTERPISSESSAVATDQSLTKAVDGSGITGG